MTRRGEEDPRRLGASLEAFLASHGWGRVGRLAAIQRCWSTVAGPELAAHVRPLMLREEVLVVAVDHQSWAAQLPFLVPRLLERLAEELGPSCPTRVEATVRPG